VLCLTQRGFPGQLLFESLVVVAKQQRFGGRVQSMATAAATPRRHDKPKFATDDIHGSVVAFYVVQREVADPILDSIGIPDIQYLGCDIVSKMACMQFRDAKNQLPRLAVSSQKKQAIPYILCLFPNLHPSKET
jgi:hypothetical protein